MSAPRLTRSRVVVALAVLVVGVLVAAVLLRSGHAAPDRDQPRRAEAARTVFAQTVAPTRDVSSTMVVPAETDWWRVLTGFAAPLDLTGTPLPDNARWLAYSTAHTDSGRAREMTSYPAVYIGFDTDAQAAAYTRPEECTCQQVTRGNVVTLLYVTADPGSEPLADLDHVNPDDLASTHGAWQINVSALVRDLSENSKWREGQRAVFDALGIDPDGDVTWTATSASPEGPWTGTLDGFDAESVDLLAVGAAVAGTVKDKCVGNACETVDQGIFEVINTMFVEDHDYEFGNRELGDPATVDEPLGDDEVLRGAIDPSFWEGSFTGLGRLHYSELASVRFTIDTDDVLTVNLELTPGTPR